MDKLRRALSGNDGEDEERGFVAQVITNIDGKRKIHV